MTVVRRNTIPITLTDKGKSKETGKGQTKVSKHTICGTLAYLQGTASSKIDGA